MEEDRRVALVTCLIDMRFSHGDVDRAVLLLLSAAGRTEAKPGCQACSVGRNAGEESQVRYSESWDSEAAFQRHVQSEEFLHVLMAMDMCCEEPQVITGTLSGRSGIAYLRELRTKRGRSAT